MNGKALFTLAEMAAIMRRMAQQRAVSRASGTDWLHAPTSPVAASIMREVGVSPEKIREAYCIARRAVLL